MRIYPNDLSKQVSNSLYLATNLWEMAGVVLNAIFFVMFRQVLVVLMHLKKNRQILMSVNLHVTTKKDVPVMPFRIALFSIQTDVTFMEIFHPRVRELHLAGLQNHILSLKSIQQVDSTIIIQVTQESNAGRTQKKRIQFKVIINLVTNLL